MAAGADELHQTVLCKEAAEFLKPRPGGRYIDGTIGAGGHSKALLSISADTQLLGIDRDQEALEAARERLAGFAGRVHLERGSFSGMEQYANRLNWEAVDGILLDLGVSSMQLDRAERGFSYRADGPLDMRMDRRHRLTASRVLNESTEGELHRIFREYGEEPRARQLSRAIVARREKAPWERTGEFAELIQRVAGDRRTKRRKAEARCFQAIRIAVNNELGELEETLDTALELLRPGGRLVIISFHSLEDRLVKQRFVHEAAECICPPGMPVCRCGKVARLRVLTRKPVTASAEEAAVNRRATSAKLRAAERLDTPTETTYTVP